MMLDDCLSTVTPCCTTVCGSNDVAWLNKEERGLYRVRDCEVVKIIVPSPADLAEEDGD